MQGAKKTDFSACPIQPFPSELKVLPTDLSPSDRNWKFVFYPSGEWLISPLTQVEIQLALGYGSGLSTHTAWTLHCGLYSSCYKLLDQGPQNFEQTKGNLSFHFAGDMVTPQKKYLKKAM